MLVDRISHEVPYYRAHLKSAVLMGTVVINDPFWWEADEKFFECTLARKLGVAVPKTVVLPNKDYIPDIDHQKSLRNLKYPMDWERIVAYTGLPAVLKPNTGGGWKDVYIVHSIDQLLSAFDQTGKKTMILQEFIDWDDYVRCICIGRTNIMPLRYNPRAPFEERYVISQPVEGPLHEHAIRRERQVCGVALDEGQCFGALRRFPVHAAREDSRVGLREVDLQAAQAVRVQARRLFAIATRGGDRRESRVRKSQASIGRALQQALGAFHVASVEMLHAAPKQGVRQHGVELQHVIELGVAQARVTRLHQVDAPPEIRGDVAWLELQRLLVFPPRLEVPALPSQRLRHRRVRLAEMGIDLRGAPGDRADALHVGRVAGVDG